MGLFSTYWTIVIIYNLLHVISTSFSTAVNLSRQSTHAELPWRPNHLPSKQVICTVGWRSLRREHRGALVCVPLFPATYLLIKLGIQLTDISA